MFNIALSHHAKLGLALKAKNHKLAMHHVGHILRALHPGKTLAPSMMSAMTSASPDSPAEEQAEPVSGAGGAMPSMRSQQGKSPLFARLKRFAKHG